MGWNFVSKKKEKNLTSFFRDKSTFHSLFYVNLKIFGIHLVKWIFENIWNTSCKKNKSNWVFFYWTSINLFTSLPGLPIWIIYFLLYLLNFNTFISSNIEPEDSVLIKWLSEDVSLISFNPTQILSFQNCVENIKVLRNVYIEKGSWIKFRKCIFFVERLQVRTKITF